MSAPDGFLVHSFAGDDPIRCKNYVREKLGLPAWSAGTANGKGIIWTYDYTNEAGELLFQVVRFFPRAFASVNLMARWVGLVSEGSGRVLYRLPEVMEAVSLERTIFIAEGEKAVDALVGLGVPATCSAWWCGEVA